MFIKSGQRQQLFSPHYKHLRISPTATLCAFFACTYLKAVWIQRKRLKHQRYETLNDQLETIQVLIITVITTDRDAALIMTMTTSHRICLDKPRKCHSSGTMLVYNHQFRHKWCPVCASNAQWRHTIFFCVQQMLFLVCTLHTHTHAYTFLLPHRVECLYK